MVTFYEIDEATGEPTKPVLYLDTLKVSTIEQTAEVAEARGGKGNAMLIAWDYGKEITVTIEDALFSPKSLAIMFGNGSVDTSGTQILKTQVYTAASAATAPTVTYVNSSGVTVTVTAADVDWYTESGASITAASMVGGAKYFAKFNAATATQRKITISADSFPGTYYITGDTYSRNEVNGKDEFFQFIIPKAKMNAENTITLEAEGDPSVFNMSLKVLRPANKKMMELVQYSL